MKDVPYDRWAAQIDKLIKKYVPAPELVLELGCGTGNLTYRLAARGYDMIALDNSCGMLSEAADKQSEYKEKILFLQQDMRGFELYGTVDAVVSAFDSVNYITDDDDLRAVFKNVCNYLNPGGAFIFDVATEKKFINHDGDGFQYYVSEEFSYIWENAYDKKKKINECATHFFIREDGGLYKKITEYHYQRMYERHEIESAAAGSGLTLVSSFDADTMKKPDGSSGRVYYIFKKG